MMNLLKLVFGLLFIITTLTTNVNGADIESNIGRVYRIIMSYDHAKYKSYAFTDSLYFVVIPTSDKEQYEIVNILPVNIKIPQYTYGGVTYKRMKDHAFGRTCKHYLIDGKLVHKINCKSTIDNFQTGDHLSNNYKKMICPVDLYFFGMNFHGYDGVDNSDKPIRDLGNKLMPLKGSFVSSFNEYKVVTTISLMDNIDFSYFKNLLSIIHRKKRNDSIMSLYKPRLEAIIKPSKVISSSHSESLDEEEDYDKLQRIRVERLTRSTQIDVKKGRYYDQYLDSINNIKVITNSIIDIFRIYDSVIELSLPKHSILYETNKHIYSNNQLLGNLENKTDFTAFMFEDFPNLLIHSIKSRLEDSSKLRNKIQFNLSDSLRFLIQNRYLSNAHSSHSERLRTLLDSIFMQVDMNVNFVLKSNPDIRCNILNVTSNIPSVNINRLCDFLESYYNSNGYSEKFKKTSSINILMNNFYSELLDSYNSYDPEPQQLSYAIHQLDNMNLTYNFVTKEFLLYKYDISEVDRDCFALKPEECHLIGPIIRFGFQFNELKSNLNSVNIGVELDRCN
jgi:hypothetical protein